MSAVVIRPGDTIVIAVDADRVPSDPDAAREYLDRVRSAAERMLPGCEVALLAGVSVAGVYRRDGAEDEPT
ncbi:hypothetical protein [Actinomadura nitritigenes]|uniref:hypothetical protein n=1 Tax=Actinomadura nitritigenes TaxID=134602 RepID=UPI003D89E176